MKNFMILLRTQILKRKNLDSDHLRTKNIQPDYNKELVTFASGWMKV